MFLVSEVYLSLLILLRENERQISVPAAPDSIWSTPCGRRCEIYVTATTGEERGIRLNIFHYEIPDDFVLSHPKTFTCLIFFALNSKGIRSINSG